jgi:hypothetical protein
MSHPVGTSDVAKTAQNVQVSKARPIYTPYQPNSTCQDGLNAKSLDLSLRLFWTVLVSMAVEMPTLILIC